jgi:hypothetical protein
MAGAIDTSRGRGIAARIAGLADAVNGDPVLLGRGRTLDTVCQLNIGDEASPRRKSRSCKNGGTSR